MAISHDAQDKVIYNELLQWQSLSHCYVPALAAFEVHASKIYSCNLDNLLENRI